MLTQAESQTIQEVIEATRLHRTIVRNNLRHKSHIGGGTLKDMLEGMDISIDKLNNLIDRDVDLRFRNFYKCPDCKTKWQDWWDSKCNDHCPDCDKEITPYKSVDVH